MFRDQGGFQCTRALSLLGVVLPILAGGCSEEAKPDAVDLAAGLDLPPPMEADGILPAFQTEAEQADEGKEDYLAVTASRDEIYGITDPPPRGARALAEWEPSDGVLVAWENGMSTYFTSLVASLEPAVPVYLLTPSVSSSRSLRDYLGSRGVDTAGLRFFEYGVDSFWTRDYGPVPLELPDGSSAFLDTRYYSYRYRDDATPTLMGFYFDVPVYRPSLSSEGGNFMTNGEGICVMTTWMFEENYYLSESDVEYIMERYYGCEQTIVLERMAGEGTGHVDMYSKFTAPDTVLVGYYEDYDQPTNAAILERNAARLASIQVSSGRNLRVVRIPMPEPEGEVFASFTNSLIVNNTAIVPTYDWARHLEEEAIAAYREALPAGFRIRTVDSSETILYGGAVHCTTMAFTAQAAAPQDTVTVSSDSGRYETEPQADILDMRTTVSEIVVPSDAGLGTVGVVSVEVDIVHSYIGDLTVTLTHDGAQVTLFRGSGSGADLQQIFTTDAFAGRSPEGSWTLSVADGADRDEGVLRSWAIEL